ncbi:MAG TPA: hypothetical protein VMZ91_10360 [Candidatus Paceibacterota bacterium]|jgi:hypothetical protein|nr:hypothetical protein [Candidatus Paceibacterota bacterium]
MEIFIIVIVFIGLIFWVKDFIRICRYGYENDLIKDPKTGKDLPEKIDDYLLK